MTATVTRPPAVRRHLRRPLLAAGALAALVLVSFVLDLMTARHFDQTYDRGYDVEGEVATDYGNGDRVPVTYDNPVVGPTQAYAGRWGVDRPEPGTTVDLEVDRDNPRRVVIAGARYQAQPTLLYLLAPLAAIAFHLARRWRYSRLERLVTPDADADSGARATPTTLRATLTPYGRGRRSVVLNLFAPTANRGDRALCTVRLLSAEGLPIGGPAFDVEVFGRPRPLSLIVARVGKQVLWPRARALGRGTHKRTARVVPLTFYRRLKVDRDKLPPHPVWWRATRYALGLCLAGLVVGSVVTGVVIGRRANATDLETNGVQVVAQVLEIDHVNNQAAVAYDDPDGGEPVLGEAPVNLTDGISVGASYPAAVDPDEPDRVRLLASAYDAATPLAVVWAGVGVLVLLLGWRVLRWRQAKAAATDGPWLRAEAWLMERGPLGREVDVVLAPPGSRQASCTLRLRKAVATSEAVSLSSSRQRVKVAGTPSPGQTLVLVVGDALIHPPRSARAPRRIED